MPYRDPCLEKLDKELSNSVRTLGIVVLVTLIIFVLLTGKSLAHIDKGDSQVEYSHCGTEAVRAAWGATARFKNAPLEFIYVNTEVVKRYFFQDNAPTDGIYVSDSLSRIERTEYTKAAARGWNKIDDWIKQGKKFNHDFSYLTAYFYKECKTND